MSVRLRLYYIRFNMPRAHFEYLVVPFGLSNAPVVFQALVNDMLRDMSRFSTVGPNGFHCKTVPFRADPGQQVRLRFHFPLWG